MERDTSILRQELGEAGIAEIKRLTRILIRNQQEALSLILPTDPTHAYVAMIQNRSMLDLLMSLEQDPVGFFEGVQQLEDARMEHL